MKKIKTIMMSFLCISSMATFGFGVYFANNNVNTPIEAKADTSFTTTEMKGVNATYDIANEVSPYSDIATEVMTTVRAGGNKYVIFQYDLISGEATTTGDYGITFGNTLLHNGTLYGNGDSMIALDEGDMGNGLRYGNTSGGSPFISSEYSNKTITVVWDRETADIAMYISAIGDEVTFDTSSGVSVTGATAQAIDLPYYWGYWSSNNGNPTAAAATVVTLSKWSQRCGLALGGGTAELENIKAFDETGKQLTLTFGNDYKVETVAPENGYLTTGANTDIQLSEPINFAYRNPNASGAETSTYVNTSSYARSGVYSSDDSLLTYTLKNNYSANLTPNGHSLVLNFSDSGHRKAQVNFGSKVKLSMIESLTFRVWGNALIYNPNTFSSAGIMLFNSNNESTVLGTDCVHLNQYLSSDQTSAPTDFVEITIPANALSCLADENGYISGMQIVRVSSSEGGYFILDEIRYNSAPLDGFDPSTLQGIDASFSPNNDPLRDTGIYTESMTSLLADPQANQYIIFQYDLISSDPTGTEYALQGGNSTLNGGLTYANVDGLLPDGGSFYLYNTSGDHALLNDTGNLRNVFV